VKARPGGASSDGAEDRLGDAPFQPVYGVASVRPSTAALAISLSHWDDWLSSLGMAVAPDHMACIPALVEHTGRPTSAELSAGGGENCATGQ
jgi:hypothetical protein